VLLLVRVDIGRLTNDDDKLLVNHITQARNHQVSLDRSRSFFKYSVVGRNSSKMLYS
jgi:hypothetical protein